MSRDDTFGIVFGERRGRTSLRGDMKYPSQCCDGHPPIGYLSNEWPGDDERCPVCRLLDHIAVARPDAEAGAP